MKNKNDQPNLANYTCDYYEQFLNWSLQSVLSIYKEPNHQVVEEYSEEIRLSDIDVGLLKSQKNAWLKREKYVWKNNLLSFESSDKIRW